MYMLVTSVSTLELVSVVDVYACFIAVRSVRFQTDIKTQGEVTQEGLVDFLLSAMAFTLLNAYFIINVLYASSS